MGLFFYKIENKDERMYISKNIGHWTSGFCPISHAEWMAAILEKKRVKIPMLKMM